MIGVKDDLVTRIERLERENRRLRCLGVLVAITIAGAAALGQASANNTLIEAQVVEAERLILRDGDGKVRIILGPRTGKDLDKAPTLQEARRVEAKDTFSYFNYGLHVYSGEARRKLSLYDPGYGGELMLRADYGDSHARFFVAPLEVGLGLRAAGRRGGESGFQVTASDASSSLRITRENSGFIDLRTDRDTVQLNLYESPEEIVPPRIRLVTSAAGGSGLAFFDSPEVLFKKYGDTPASAFAPLPRMTIGQGSDLSPSVKLFDSNGTTRAALGTAELETRATGDVTKTPESSLVLFDKDGRVIRKIP